MFLDENLRVLAKLGTTWKRSSTDVTNFLTSRNVDGKQNLAPFHMSKTSTKQQFQ